MSGAASSISIFAEQAFRRAAGARLIPGNSARILKDAAENYPAWLEAIESARHTIYFECYIIHEDKQGQVFADALARKVREGVRVRLIYDWMGAFNATSNWFWRRLRESGIDARCFNPPRLDSPFGWLGRDHRKMLVIDGRVGFVSGLCVGLMWVGDRRAGIEPWRDTGIEIRGPAVAELERAFAQMWAACGSPIPAEELASMRPVPPFQEAGDVALRIVASMPNLAGVYRLDQIIAAAARETLWLTDAYFAGTTPYIQALSAASRDGVDVRLLVPQATDIPVMRALSRTGYRPLLESGVRVYEWNGPMMHAKTAVADGHWARIGSTNLNPLSWVNNWELDVVIEDKRIGEEMERMFMEDLRNATEIVLTVERKLAPAFNHERRLGSRFSSPLSYGLRASIGGGSSSRAAAGAIQIGRTVGAAITNRRALGPAEARIMGIAGALLVAASIIAVLWPRVVSIPLAVIGVWVAVSAFIRAFRLRREGKREERRLKPISD
ncbi:MAG TPA: phospholipase D-like domain-containing protein [Blastocatellia bacterium]